MVSSVKRGATSDRSTSLHIGKSTAKTTPDSPGDGPSTRPRWSELAGFQFRLQASAQGLQPYHVPRSLPRENARRTRFLKPSTVCRASPVYWFGEERRRDAESWMRVTHYKRSRLVTADGSRKGAQCVVLVATTGGETDAVGQ
jgi:hypothetical protein